MRYAVASHDLEGSQPNDTEIEPEALSLKIFDVESNFFRNGQFIPTVDLRPSGQTWLQFVNARLGSQGNQVILIEQGWTRAYKTHVADQYTPKLRQLIEARAAQERTNRRQMNSRVVQQMRCDSRCTHTHAPELRHPEDSVSPSNPIRPVKHGSRRGEPYQYSNQQYGQDQ